MTGAARLRAQGLGEARARDAHTAVRTALAIQAQDTRSSRLGVRARSEGLTVDDVARACDEERSLVRTWAMRATLHMLAAEDVRWIVGLLGPGVVRKHERRRAGLGLTPDLADRALAAIPAALDGGPLTRAELVDRLNARGLGLDTSDQAPAHLVLLASASGLTCRGPDRSPDLPTYVLLDDWVAPEAPRERDAALAELARRFRAAYGPAEAADLAYWSGLPAGDARRAWALAGPPPAARGDDGAPPPRLLPAFDGVLLGHRDRTPLVPAEDAAQLTSGSWILPTVVAGGRAVGTWRRDGEVVRIAPFRGRLPRGSVRALRAEAADVGRFLGVPVRMELAA
ncbi:MAG TPA: winged helix DNA-binding domain-containing protein [Miltoncostaea sp.]|nr:winged helix DNA-binding domain-containing protein [Miltoncostaea sp.]